MARYMIERHVHGAESGVVLDADGLGVKDRMASLFASVVGRASHKEGSMLKLFKD